MKIKPVYIIAIIVCAFVLGGFTHSFYKGAKTDADTRPIRENSSKYQYINPLILLDNSTTEYAELKPLKEDVKAYINKEIHNKRAERISFYYRDVDSSIWTGVNPDDKFVPASILKVGTVMVYLRLAEEDVNVMNEKLLYKKNPEDWQNYPPNSVLDDGYYGVARLISQSIIESDNTAAIALYSNKSREHEELYNSLRLPYPPEKLEDYMTPRQVSYIFRALYSSTYLINSYSEQVLELLTQTSFNKGITQGVDSKIKVAHKFGEHMTYYKDNADSPDHQLHDCGIVYYPEKPYFICVMTEGKNLENLEKVLKDISAITFEFVKRYSADSNTS